MKSLTAPVVAISLGVLAATAALPHAQTAAADVYHVHFTKAVPGQAAALGKALIVPDPKAPMPDHFVVLRHQEGDDWDYAVIQHLGQRASIEVAPAAPDPARNLQAWHTDTFVSGPPWAEFTRALGGAAPSAVYTVGIHRSVPGHRDDLRKMLSQPSPAAGKISTGNVVLQHLEGSDWTFLSITRYNSWQDFAADRSGASSSDQAGWSDIRQHVAFHRDTIADRIFPR